MRVVEAMSVSRVRTRDSGVAYSLRSSGGSKRSRSTIRWWGTAGRASATTVPVTTSRPRVRASPRRDPRPTPESVDSSTSTTRSRLPRCAVMAHSRRTPVTRTTPSSVGARTVRSPQAMARPAWATTAMPAMSTRPDRTARVATTPVIRPASHGSTVIAGKAVSGTGRVRESRHTVTVAARTARAAFHPLPASGRTHGATPTWTSAASASVGAGPRRAPVHTRATTAPAPTPPAAAAVPTNEPKGGTNRTEAISARTTTSPRSVHRAGGRPRRPFPVARPPRPRRPPRGAGALTRPSS